MEKLKLCPFCGWGTIVDGGFLNHKCTCNSCGASTKGYPTWEMAVESWNRRPGEADAQLWIPCSKEMPQKEGRYIVTERNIFNNIEVRFRFWKPDCNLWSGDQMNEVLAWCEIPEPWEGAEDAGET